MGRLFLRRHRAATGPLARACVRMSALPANGKIAPMPKTPVATEIHQALDVHRDLTTKITLDLVVKVDRLANLTDLVLVEIIGELILGDPRHAADLRRAMRADSVNVLERNHNMLSPGDI